MADNIDPTAGPYNVRTIDRSGTGPETQVMQLDVGGAGATERLVTAVALADAVANPTLASFGAHLLGFNGTTWDRVRVSATGVLAVDDVPTIVSNNAITATSMNSLASTNFVALPTVNNASALYREAMVHVTVAFGAGTSATGFLDVAVAMSGDGGTTFDDNALAAIIGNIPAVASATRRASFHIPFPLPTHWRIVISNQSGAALAASGHTVTYTGTR